IRSFAETPAIPVSCSDLESPDNRCYGSPPQGCTGGPYEIPCKWGVFPDVLCGGNDRTLQFAKDVLNELMDIFPSPYIHIGGDECPKVRWEKCPVCQAKIRELGLNNRTDIQAFCHADIIDIFYFC
ncbi:family 20 glycosylhydrolase, partial [Phocaeicola vulgatus]|uniref:family 20 glycosylhydrolase n=1 Tax=Phocaeicola vulgatus TaxID=821 RepID=UPI0023B15A12